MTLKSDLAAIPEFIRLLTWYALHPRSAIEDKMSPRLIWNICSVASEMRMYGLDRILMDMEDE